MIRAARALAMTRDRVARRFSATVAWCLGLLLFLPTAGQGAGSAIPPLGPPSLDILWQDAGIAVSTDAAGRKLEIRWKDPGGTGPYVVTVDDSPEFRTPIVKRRVTARELAIDLLESGVAPGIRYFVRVEPGGLRVAFRLRPPTWKELLPRPDYLQRAWEIAGRAWLQRYSGLKWNDKIGNWELDPQWPHAETGVGPQAYYLEYAARGAVNLALVAHDIRLMDELAGFYLAYLKRFTTLGALRGKQSPRTSTELLDNQGPDTARTLGWVEKTADHKERVRECTLCNSQFFHPAARLIRAISTLSGSERTPVMKQFISAYVPLIIRDHLFRLVYEARWNYWGARDLPKELINIWRAIIGATAPPKLSYQHAMLDRDLWLIATAAEVLGANANDPELVPLSPDESARLREIVGVGVQLFRKKRTLYLDTRDFQGRVVRSASYFNGDFDDHADMAYAGYEGSGFPRPAEKRRPHGGSWDISHFYRVPVFLRSLWDNRKATGLSFPQANDIRLVINQYVYRVFQGDFDRPLFRNFFDGRDGWYRVGYHGPAFGYPPSRDCDMRDKNRPCLTVAGVFGWGLLSFMHEDLAKLQFALMSLAARSDPATVAFRDRYYTYNGESFAFSDTHGGVKYPFLLFAVLADVAERFL
jgi:hypothetical protein